MNNSWCGASVRSWRAAAAATSGPMPRGSPSVTPMRIPCRRAASLTIAPGSARAHVDVCRTSQLGDDLGEQLLELQVLTEPLTDLDVVDRTRARRFALQNSHDHEHVGDLLAADGHRADDLTGRRVRQVEAVLLLDRRDLDRRYTRVFIGITILSLQLFHSGALAQPLRDGVGARTGALRIFRRQLRRDQDVPRLDLRSAHAFHFDQVEPVLRLDRWTHGARSHEEGDVLERRNHRAASEPAEITAGFAGSVRIEAAGELIEVVLGEDARINRIRALLRAGER